MTATSTQLRRRHAARRMALARQQKLNEERRRRDEQELDLAADFAVSSDECATARAAVHAAELALGRVVDTLIGQLRIRYDRAADLLDTAEEELKRLRQVATDTTGSPTPAAEATSRSTARRARASRVQRASPAPPAAASARPDAPAGGQPDTDIGVSRSAEPAAP